MSTALNSVSDTVDLCAMFQMLGFSILFVVHITVAVLNFFLPDLFDIIEVVRIEL